jgi:hypothetical protein
MNPYPAGSEMAAIWQLGHDEASGDVGMTYDDDSGSPRSVAYDEGRNAGAATAPQVCRDTYIHTYRDRSHGRPDRQGERAPDASSGA